MIIIAASGPSLNREDIEFFLRLDIPVLAINNSHQIIPEAIGVFAADFKWWKCYHSSVKNENKMTTSQNASLIYKDVKRVGQRETKIVKDKDAIYGINSGICGISLAVHQGNKEIGLLGFDFQHTDGKAHFFGNHPKGMLNAHGVDNWLNYLTEYKKWISQKKIKIFNFTRETAIPNDIFQKKSINCF